MSTDRETTRVVRSWLEEGATRLPDPVLDAVLDQLPATPQRRATWWPVRRLPEMNNTAKLALGAAAVVVVALLGIGFLLPGGPGMGGPGPSLPTAEPSVAEPSVAEPSPSPEGLLPEGPHVLWDGDGVPMTVTIPAPDWYGQPGEGILQKNDFSDGPDGAGMIVFPGDGDLFVYGDPCEWSTTRPETPSTTVDEFVAAMTAQASRDASEPVDVTVDGYAGKSITVHVPEDARFSECDQGLLASWGVPGDDPARYHQDPGQIDKLWIVDVDGELVVIDTAYYEGTPQAALDELEAIVESTTFE